MNVHIIYEDKDILVVEKPVGMPVQSGKSIEMDLVNYLKNHIFRQNQTKSLPYIGLIHRLDKPVGGVMVFAKHPSAARFLSEQVQNRKMTKKYLAVTDGSFPKKTGSLEHYLAREAKGNVSMVVNAQHPLAKIAVLHYKILEESCVDGKVMSLTEVELVTGRHHQIRVQMAEEGHGLLGDRKYNNELADRHGNIALFAYALSFVHPKTKKKVLFQRACPNEYPFTQFEQCFSISDTLKI